MEQNRKFKETEDDHFKFDLENIDLDCDILNPEEQETSAVPFRLRRWHHFNYCRRLRKMRKTFLRDTKSRF